MLKRPRIAWRSPLGAAFSFALILLTCSGPSFAAAGSEAASFLEIPVGGRPAALGSSYSALATDAYAPIWNPAGLGFVDATQLAGMHLSYLETINYEFVSFAHPLGAGKAFGVSGQYFSPGNLIGTNDVGARLGDFSGHYAAYSLAYGQTLGDAFSIGLTGKLIDARISDVSAQAYGFDTGALYQVNRQLRLAAVVANVGTQMKFLQEGDSLPSNARIAALYSPIDALNLTVEGVHDFNGLTSAHAGVEWRPISYVALRTGFRTDTLRNLPGLSGLTAGIGLQAWGQEFDYAWVPLGDLGNTQYFSLLIRFGTPAESSENQHSLKRVSP